MAFYGVVTSSISATVEIVSCRHAPCLSRPKGSVQSGVAMRALVSHTFGIHTSKTLAISLSSRRQFTPRGVKTWRASEARATCRQVEADFYLLHLVPEHPPIPLTCPRKFRHFNWGTPSTRRPGCNNTLLIGTPTFRHSFQMPRTWCSP
eukprot:1196235-Prorocentrum_minimum.AAC.1